MTTLSARSVARNEHLTRAAQSAGEAFACPMHDEVAERRSLTLYRLLWVTAVLIVVTAFFTAL